MSLSSSRPVRRPLPHATAGALALSLALAAGGCRCDRVSAVAAHPEFLTPTSALAFEACADHDESGRPVEGATPHTQRLTLENRSNVGAPLRVSITGPDADAFRLVEPPPERLGPNDEVSVLVAFSPHTRGELRAELRVDDGLAETDEAAVTLVGTGLALPSQPTLEVAPQRSGLEPDGGARYGRCTAESSTAECALDFPDTAAGQTAELRLKLINRGCPPLRVTGLQVASFDATETGFAVVEPAQLPSETAPLILPGPDGGREAEFVVRFAPSSGDPGVDPYRRAWLAVTSNDPRSGDGLAQPGRVELSGLAAAPSLFATPTRCDFSNVADACGLSARVPNVARFTLVNDGVASVRVVSARFASSGSAERSADGRFTVAASVEGAVLAPGARLDVEVRHVDRPIVASDRLRVEASLVGAPASAGGAGVVELLLRGGTPPCLSTEPLEMLAFEDPSEELSEAPVLIRNGAGCGELTVTAVSVDASPVFSLAAPLLEVPFKVAPGGEARVTVRYRRPPAGGLQLSTLRVSSDDPDFPPPEHRMVQLAARSPLDPIPVAELRACRGDALAADPQCAQGATSTLTVALSGLAERTVVLSGIESVDPDPARPQARPRVAKYRFLLLPGPGGGFPPGASTASLERHGQYTELPMTTLTIAPEGVGTYRIALSVMDARGQTSANAAVMNVIVVP